MSEALETYLDDHLAGAAYAIDLVEFMRDQHNDPELRQFASHLLIEIEQDRDTLRQLAERIGAGGSTLKEAASWFGEKLTRMKLGHDRDEGLATFEALEFLVVGIHGKFVLWRALNVVASSDARLAGFNFERLAARAQRQHDKVDKLRLEVARQALLPRSTGVNDLRYSGSPKACNHANGGSAMQKNTLIGSVVVTLGIVLAISMLPDIIRYMKIRSM
jgi:hypothetical protein